MKTKELKLKKETLINFTNLNQKEIEELKGGVANKYQDAAISELTFILSYITVDPISIIITVPNTYTQ